MYFEGEKESHSIKEKAAHHYNTDHFEYTDLRVLKFLP